jgi:DNA-directed RNA polymerase specialized sigma24 family protein
MQAANDPSAGYDEMLRLLADDERLAAERFMLVRAKLILYFEGRRISPAEDFADEVLHRTAQKIASGEKVEDINRYIYGIARFVRLESHRRRKTESLDEITSSSDGFRQQMPEALKVAPNTPAESGGSRMENCLSECLGKLPKDNKELLLSYYAADERKGSHIEQRRTLAEKLGKTPGALQKQICLLRQKVSVCANDCVKNAA